MLTLLVGFSVGCCINEEKVIKFSTDNFLFINAHCSHSVQSSSILTMIMECVAWEWADSEFQWDILRYVMQPYTSVAVHKESFLEVNDACTGSIVITYKDQFSAVEMNANLYFQNGMTPLFITCWGGYLSVLEHLIAAKANINTPKKVSCSFC